MKRVIKEKFQVITDSNIIYIGDIFKGYETQKNNNKLSHIHILYLCATTNFSINYYN